MFFIYQQKYGARANIHFNNWTIVVMTNAVF